MSFLDTLGHVAQVVTNPIGSALDGIEHATAHPAQVAAPAGTPKEDKPQGTAGGIMQGVGDWWRGVHQEGLGAVLDPFGAADRQKAQRELGGMFQIKSAADLAKDPNHAQNAVTQEQFQKLAREYSDIRMDRTNIKFNTDNMNDKDAAAFKQGSMHDLASIMQTNGGRDLIDNLAHNSKDHNTTLSPLFKKNAKGSTDDATTGLDNTNGYAAPDGKTPNDKYMKADGTEGKGIDSRVRYNPGQSIAPADADLAQDKWLPWRSDVLLYHELVHSMDQTHGTMNPNKAGADGDGVPYDVGVPMGEHRAAGLGTYANEKISENAYRKARRDIAAQGGADATRAGDATMPDRDTYFYHQQVAAPPTGGPGSHGTTVPGDPDQGMGGD